MKIAILTGPFPPQNSGVGDHARRLALELAQLGHEVGIWTAEPHPVAVAEISINPLPQPWNRSQLRQLQKDLQKWKAEKILIEYTPQSMSPKTLGVHPFFPLWIWLLKRRLKIPFILIAHELNYPVEASLPGILVGIPHLLQLFGLLFSCSHVICSTEHFAKKVQRLSSWALAQRKAISWLPIGSNIDRGLDSLTHPSGEAPEFKELRKKHGIPKNHRILLHFGGLHPTHLYDFTFAALKEIQAKHGKDSASLVCIGVSAAQMKEYFQKNPDFQKIKNVSFLGYLSEQEVSKWLLAADLVLAPYMDGISTRRSTAMAAFAHARAVLTTLSYASVGTTPWSTFCATTPCDLLAYSKKAAEVFSKKQELLELGQAARQVYAQSFDWPVLARNLLNQTSSIRSLQPSRSKTDPTKKRILHIYSGNLFGGIERVLLTLAQYQKEFPDTTQEFALCFNGPLLQELQTLYGKTHLLPALTEDPSYLEISPTKWSRPWSILRARRGLRKVLESESYTAVICHAPWALSIFGKTVQEAGLPLIFWAHDTFMGRGWLERLAKKTQPTFIVCNSVFTQRTIQKQFKNIQTLVIHCPVSVPKEQLANSDRTQTRARVRKTLAISDHELTLLQVSRLEPWKGQRIFIEALALLNHALPWRALIVGGAQRPQEEAFLQELKALTQNLKIQDRVRFLGQRNDVTALMVAADLFVQPNLSPEPFGISMVEAMYCGLPVVTVAGGGANETVNPSTGVLLEHADPRELANALHTLLLDSNQRAGLSKNGPARAKRISDPIQQIRKLNTLVGQLSQNPNTRLAA